MGSMRTEESRAIFSALNAGHTVVVGGRIIDGADAAVERFEEEGEIAIAAAEIEHRAVADQGLEIPAAAGEQAVEQRQVAEAVPGIPAGIGLGEFAFDAAQALFEIESAGDDVADFELLDDRPGTQAPFPGCQGH